MASKLIFFYIQWGPRLQGFLLTAVYPYSYSSIRFLYFYKSPPILLIYTKVHQGNELPGPHESRLCFLPSSIGRSVCTVSVCVKSMRCAPCLGSWRRWWQSWCPTSRGTPSQTTTRDVPRRSTPGCLLDSSQNRSVDGALDRPKNSTFRLVTTDWDSHVPEKTRLLLPEVKLQLSCDLFNYSLLNGVQLNAKANIMQVWSLLVTL